MAGRQDHGPIATIEADSFDAQRTQITPEQLPLHNVHCQTSWKSYRTQFRSIHQRFPVRSVHPRLLDATIIAVFRFPNRPVHPTRVRVQRQRNGLCVVEQRFVECPIHQTGQTDLPDGDPINVLADPVVGDAINCVWNGDHVFAVRSVELLAFDDEELGFPAGGLVSVESGHLYSKLVWLNACCSREKKKLGRMGVGMH